MKERLGPEAVLLRGFAAGAHARLLAALHAVLEQAPLRHMITPGGFRMSVAMTNCGSLGWITDRRGYRYEATDPETGAPWPAMPAAFLCLAQDAAAHAGFERFVPDACLVNQYLPGARLTMHRDSTERDFSAPIVSVSLGMPAVFYSAG